jgi:DNA-binding LytR/AlgR family response regulator
MRCLVVDDDAISAKVLERYIGQCTGLQLVGTCDSAVEAVNVLGGGDIDLLFLDVEMPEMTGIELARSLADGPPIVLVTAKKEYALEAFEADVVDYLLKPVEYARFLKAVNRARTRVVDADTDPGDDFVFVRVDGRLVRIELADLHWVEAQGDYVMLHTPQKRYMIHATMKSMERKLPAGTFIRVHRSHIVRVDKIADIDESTLVIGREVIPIGASYRSSLMRRLRTI